MSNVSAIMRNRGKNGPKNVRLTLIPNSEMGRRRHAGQRSAIAPTVLPRPVALFVPTGHDPVFLLQFNSPAFNVIKIIRITVKISSIFVASGRGGKGILGIIPSSHAKKK